MVMVPARGARSTTPPAEYLDYMLGSGPLLLGHCRPDVVGGRAPPRWPRFTYFALNEPAIRLAETIGAVSRAAEAVRFQTTGSEATFAAVRLARAFTGRDRVLKFEGGWHGGHDLRPAFRPRQPPPFPEAAPDCDGIPAPPDTTCWSRRSTTPKRRPRLIESPSRRTGGRHRRAAATRPDARARLPAGRCARSPGGRHRAGVRRDRHGFRLAWGGAQDGLWRRADLACYGKVIFEDRFVLRLIVRMWVFPLATP